MKKYNEFLKEGKELVTEDYKEQCVEYKKDAIEQANRIIKCFENMVSDGYYYYGAKQVSRQLQDVADNLENYKDTMDKNSQPENQVNSTYSY